MKINVGKILKFAKRYAHRSEDAEDLSSYITQKIIEGRKATYKQIYIDWVRGRLGKKSNKHEAKNRCSYDDLAQCLGNKNEIKFSEIVEGLGESDRLILAMRFLVGLDFEQIGEIVGLTGSGVFIRVKRAIERIRSEDFGEKLENKLARKDVEIQRLRRRLRDLRSKIETMESDLKKARERRESRDLRDPGECRAQGSHGSQRPQGVRQLGELISLEEIELEHINRVVARCRTQQQAAQVLKISVRCLRNRTK